MSGKERLKKAVSVTPPEVSQLARVLSTSGVAEITGRIAEQWAEMEKRATTTGRAVAEALRRLDTSAAAKVGQALKSTGAAVLAQKLDCAGVTAVADAIESHDRGEADREQAATGPVHDLEALASRFEQAIPKVAEHVDEAVRPIDESIRKIAVGFTADRPFFTEANGPTVEEYYLSACRGLDRKYGLHVIRETVDHTPVGEDEEGVRCDEDGNREPEVEALALGQVPVTVRAALLAKDADGENSCLDEFAGQYVAAVQEKAGHMLDHSK